MPEIPKRNDAAERKIIQDNIDRFGCHLVLIEAGSYLPAFVYSIGLFQKFGYPELICFGLKPEVAAAILNHACSLIDKGEAPVPGELYRGYLEGYSIQFLEVDRSYYANYLGYGGWFYGNFNFPALQLVWPDKQHQFPWQPDFNPAWKFKQPLLDRNTDFKFYEERDLGVFTTSEVLGGQPILYVYHDEDGDWQFHTNAEADLNDGKIVCLEEITQLDPTINDVYFLQLGWKAWRSAIGEKWEWKNDSEGD